MHTRSHPAFKLFLGAHGTPDWYKFTVITMLGGNLLLYAIGLRFALGWIMLGEFIFFLAMALRCYPLLPGGLLVIEALALRLATPDGVYHEAKNNFPVILLLMFVVAGVYFLRELLEVIFRKILLGVKSKVILALTFQFAGALLSAFLDALTVISVVITVGLALADTYYQHRSKLGEKYSKLKETYRTSGRPSKEEQDQLEFDLKQFDLELEQFRGFLRSLVMHAAIGTMLGGVMTKVGEPQNLLIAHVMEETLPSALAKNWSFGGFIIKMAPVTVPTFIAGIATAIVVEKWKLFGYGVTMPDAVRQLLTEQDKHEQEHRSPEATYRLKLQGLFAILFVLGLATHIAEVGLLGLALIIVTTAFMGVKEEEQIGKAFTASLPFCALLCVFFGIVAVIEALHLFKPVVDFALAYEAKGQQMTFYSASAGLSSISDNVFVATTFINEAKAAYKSGAISAEQFEKLALAINAGTNIPSIATPNGQAAFLFLLTSKLAERDCINLGYGRMFKMALPFTIVLTIVSALALWFLI